MRGDEPLGGKWLINCNNVVPTCVGMNLLRFEKCALAPGCPHMRGDEPRAQEEIRAAEAVVPTCVGMNHMQLKRRKDRIQLSPHAWG